MRRFGLGPLGHPSHPLFPEGGTLSRMTAHDAADTQRVSPILSPPSVTLRSALEERNMKFRARSKFRRTADWDK